MDKIRVRWLEPKRAFGKTSFVFENDIICDKEKDLPAGCIVKAKWKSSDRIYKAILLAPLQAKCSQGKEISECKLNGSLDSSTEESPSAHFDRDTDLEDEEDYAQASVNANDTSSTSSHEDEIYETVTENNSEEPLQCEVSTVQYDMLQELKHVIKSEMDVMRCDFEKEIKEEMRREFDAFRKDMEMEMDSVKRKYEKENANLKKVVEKLLREVQDDVAQQIKLVLDAVSELNDIASSRDAPNHIVKHIRPAVEQSEQQEHSPVVLKDGKREQAAFGRVERGYVVAYEDDKKILSIKCDRYSKMFHGARTPTSFLRKLLRESFSSETLAKSNYNGGKVTCFNGVIKKKVLDRDRVHAIIEQVKLEFPGSASGMEADGKLRDAVNEECRQAARKLRLQEKYGT
ncbi:hypothetical protein HOLleu_32092 [Holothuria leucospilota]|uniref:BEN domain-containing protein n=1 Tax=Holothuria leucospilota TaxID=206669 RepID=A0A9Q0YTK6_HOLLE|nr:hypothetical protein HOLleu_32092 [Holothuria leucospilota]